MAESLAHTKYVCKWKGVTIIEGHLMCDHVHQLLSIPPKYSVSNFVGYLKGKSAMMIFERHANLKYKYGNSIRFIAGKWMYLRIPSVNTLNSDVLH